MFSLLSLVLLAACNSGNQSDCSSNAQIKLYADADEDGHGDPATEVVACEERGDDGELIIPFGKSPTNFDCDDTRSDVNPDAYEQCDGLDNDCDGEADEGLREIDFYFDGDGDGYGDPNNVTSSCAPVDGYVVNPYDCNDNDPQSYPGAIEFCDGGFDNDCDGLADDRDLEVDRDTMPFWYADLDNDGFGSKDPDYAVQACAKPNFPNIVIVDNDDDCDDFDPDQHPGAGEVCNGEDDDCDGQLDDSDADLDETTKSTFYRDDDGDGFGVNNGPEDLIEACDPPWFYADNYEDCDDTDPRIRTPDNTYWYPDADYDGWGDPNEPQYGPTCDPGPGWAPRPLPPFDLGKMDCDDNNDRRNPGLPEVCDDIDNDCDELVDDEDPSIDPAELNTWYTDRDGDGFGDDNTEVVTCDNIDGAVDRGGDCDDQLYEVNPDATEVCNFGIDDDCNGLADAADPNLDPTSSLTWYQDYDGDGFGNADVEQEACEQPPGFTDNPDDCNDNYPEIGDSTTWKLDNDGDGVGSGAPTDYESCDPPGPDYVRTDAGDDCDDNNPNRFPGNPEQCLNGLDEDCDFDDCDVCAGAENGAALTHSGSPYTLSGSLSSFTDDLDLGAGNTCTGGATAGSEGFIPIELRNNDAVTVHYSSTNNAVAYLVDDCNAVPDECRNGANNEGPGAEEYMSYVNKTGGVQRVYLGLDCQGAACTDFDVDIEIARALPYLPDSCNEALAFPPFETGSYALGGSLIGGGNELSLEPDGCTGNQTLGSEAIVPVHLEANQRLDVRYRQLQADASLYFVTDCNDRYGATCIDGADVVNNGLEESLSFQNGASPMDFYVILDCFGSSCHTFQADLFIE